MSRRSRDGNDDLTPEEEAAVLDTFLRGKLGIEPASPDALAAARASGLLESEDGPGSEPSEDQLLEAFWQQRLPQGGGL